MWGTAQGRSLAPAKANPYKIITCKPPKWNSACRQHEDEQRQGKKREKLRAEAKVAKLIAQLRKEMGGVEPRRADTSTEGD